MSDEIKLQGFKKHTPGSKSDHVFVRVAYIYISRKIKVFRTNIAVFET